MEKDFNELVKLSFAKQIERLEYFSSKIGHAYRVMLIEKLQNKIIETIEEFFNSPKSSGIC
jgi:hypothetical protein